jgi:hypothetical protein
VRPTSVLAFFKFMSSSEKPCVCLRRVAPRVNDIA